MDQKFIKMNIPPFLNGLSAPAVMPLDPKLIGGPVQMLTLPNGAPITVPIPEFPLRAKKICDNAVIPEYSTEGAAAFDFHLCTALHHCDGRSYFTDHIDIHPGESVYCHTGIILEIPEGMCGLLMSRSSLSNNNHITLCDNVGLFDSDYRGEVTFNLHNESNEIHVLEDGMRIAQMVIIPSFHARIIESNELTETKRGEGAYGSTGLK